MEWTGTVPHGVGSRTLKFKEKNVHDACRFHFTSQLGKTFSDVVYS